MTIKLEGLYTCTFRGRKEILVRYYAGEFLDYFVLLKTGGHTAEPVDGFVQSILKSRPDLFGNNAMFGEGFGAWGMWYVNSALVGNVHKVPAIILSAPDDGEWE